MREAPNALQWRIRAMTELNRAREAESRLSSVLGHSSISVLAAADEVQVAARDATVWLTANPCPDSAMGAHVARILNTYAELALFAQRSATDPSANLKLVRSHLRDLLAVIVFHSQTLDDW